MDPAAAAGQLTYHHAYVRPSDRLAADTGINRQVKRCAGGGAAAAVRTIINKSRQRRPLLLTLLIQQQSLQSSSAAAAAHRRPKHPADVQSMWSYRFIIDDESASVEWTGMRRTCSSSKCSNTTGQTVLVDVSTNPGTHTPTPHSCANEIEIACTYRPVPRSLFLRS